MKKKFSKNLEFSKIIYIFAMLEAYNEVRN